MHSITKIELALPLHANTFVFQETWITLFEVEQAVQMYFYQWPLAVKRFAQNDMALDKEKFPYFLQLSARFKESAFSNSLLPNYVLKTYMTIAASLVSFILCRRQK